MTTMSAKIYSKHRDVRKQRKAHPARLCLPSRVSFGRRFRRRIQNPCQGIRLIAYVMSKSSTYPMLNLMQILGFPSQAWILFHESDGCILAGADAQKI